MVLGFFGDPPGSVAAPGDGISAFDQGDCLSGLGIIGSRVLEDLGDARACLGILHSQDDRQGGLAFDDVIADLLAGAPDIAGDIQDIIDDLERPAL